MQSSRNAHLHQHGSSRTEYGDKGENMNDLLVVNVDNYIDFSQENILSRDDRSIRGHSKRHGIILR